MELLQLRYFLVAAKYEHMTKAAEVLRIAQPALSQSIKRLEQELGIPLFDREKRNIRLNDAGRFLEQKLLPIMAALEELPAEIKKRDLMNQRTIYLNLLAATRLVTDCIIAYKELHPEVIFRLVQDPAREHDDICISTAFPGEFKHEEDHLLLRERFLWLFRQILPTLPCVLSACPCFRTKVLSASPTTAPSGVSAIASAWKQASPLTPSVRRTIPSQSGT